MGEVKEKPLWVYWAFLLSVCVLGLWWISKPDVVAECKRLKESYLVARLGYDTAASIRLGGEQLRREALAKLELARFDLVDACGERSTLEADEHFARTGSVIID